MKPDTKTAHTPGPWEIGTRTRGYEVCTIHGVERQPTEDGLGQSWVYVFPPSVVSGEWHWPDETEQLANARLIAAAPEMLAALKEYRRAVAYYIEREKNGDDPEGVRLKRIKLAMLDALVAKAEGRQS